MDNVYEFDEEGKLIPVIADEDKDGIVAENGGLYYYVNGEKTYAGLIQIGKYYYYVNGEMQKGKTGVVKLEDEEGKTFYIYVCTSGNLATGKYWPTYRNDLLARGEYDWGTDGRYYPAQ